jgi:hypothetical protein
MLLWFRTRLRSHCLPVRLVGNPDIERQRIGTGNLTNGTTAKAKENYGPTIVSQCSELAAQLIEREIEVVDENGAPAGEKLFVASHVSSVKM